MSQMQIPSQIRSPLVSSLFAYWDRIRAGRMAPRWADLDPGDIRPLLPHVMVMEILGPPFDVLYRIVGTAVVEAYGHDFTWETLLTPAPDADTPAWLDIFRRYFERKGPCFGQYRIALDRKETLVVDAGVFPLSSDGTTVDRLIGLEDWATKGTFRPKLISPRPKDFVLLPPVPAANGC
jgi:hypothetical protein